MTRSKGAFTRKYRDRLGASTRQGPSSATRTAPHSTAMHPRAVHRSVAEPRKQHGGKGCNKRWSRAKSRPARNRCILPRRAGCSMQSWELSPPSPLDRYTPPYVAWTKLQQQRGWAAGSQGGLRNSGDAQAQPTGSFRWRSPSRRRRDTRRRTWSRCRQRRPRTGTGCTAWSRCSPPAQKTATNSPRCCGRRLHIQNHPDRSTQYPLLSTLNTGTASSRGHERTYLIFFYVFRICFDDTLQKGAPRTPELYYTHKHSNARVNDSDL